MKKLIGNFTSLIFAGVLTFGLCDCEKRGGAPAEAESSPASKSGISTPSADFSDDVYKKLSAIAERHFSDNGLAREKWIKMQLSAAFDIESIVPEIPLEAFSEIKAAAMKRHAEDYLEAKRDIESQCKSYAYIERVRSSNTPQAFGFAYGRVSEIYPDDYTLRARQLDEWLSLYTRIRSMCPLDDVKNFGAMCERAISMYPTSAPSVLAEVKRQAEARKKLASYGGGVVGDGNGGKTGVLLQ